MMIPLILPRELGGTLLYVHRKLVGVVQVIMNSFTHLLLISGIIPTYYVSTNSNVPALSSSLNPPVSPLSSTPTSPLSPLPFLPCLVPWISSMPYLLLVIRGLSFAAGSL